MIRVPVQGSLIEGAMRSGYKFGMIFEVLVGLPMDAQLCGVEFEKETGMIVFEFSQPRVPDSEVVELNLVLKATPAQPVSKGE